MRFKIMPPSYLNRFASYIIKMHEKEWLWTPENSGLKAYDWIYIDDRFRIKRGNAKTKYLWDAPYTELVKLSEKKLKTQEKKLIEAAMWLQEVDYFNT